MKKQYILLKDSPELEKGAILKEQCDNGNQGFDCIIKDKVKFDDQNCVYHSRKTVMENPKWFEEVRPLWISIAKVRKVKEFLTRLR